MHYFIKKVLLSLINRDAEITKSDILFFADDVDRTQKLVGKHFGSIADHTILDCRENGLSVSNIGLPWTTLNNSKAFLNISTFNRLFFFYRTIAYVFKLLKRKDISDSLKEKPFSHLIQKSSAKFVIGIGLTEDLCRAANKLGVETIEIQHAMGYSRPYLSWERRRNIELPSKTICYDTATEKTYKYFKKVEPILLRHPYLLSVNKKDNAHSIAAMEALHLDELKHDPKKLNILYCMQWGYDGEIDHLKGHIENSIFPEVVGELIDLTCDTVNWHFRLHPMQIYGYRYKNLRNYLSKYAETKPNVYYKYASYNDMRTVTSITDAMLTMSSLSVYDAALLGQRSGFLCPTVKVGGRNQNTGEDLLSRGYLRKLDWDLDDLRAWIEWVKIKPKFEYLQSQKRQIHEYLAFLLSRHQ